MKREKHARPGRRTREKKENRRFERRIPIDSLAPQRRQREEAVELTVGGFYRGSV